MPRTIVEQAARKAGPDGAVLVLVDADDDCAAELGRSLRERARQARADRDIAVVLPVREFEAWFLASAESLGGHRGLPVQLESPPDPEAVRDAKGWLSARMTVGRAYGPQVDQAALAQALDFRLAERAGSFRKFMRDLERLAAYLLAALLLALPARAAIPADLLELTRQIEEFPKSKAGSQSESARLARFFDLYWAATMREAPDFASYIGYAGVEDRLPDYSPEAFAHSQRLMELERAALASIDRSRLTPAEQLSYDLLRRSFEIGLEGEGESPTAEPSPGRYLLVSRMGNRMTAALGLLYYMPARTVADYENMLARLRGFPRLVEQGIALLEEGARRGITPPKVTLDGVADQVLAPLAYDDPLESPTLEPFQRIPDSVPAAERERLRAEAAEVFRRQVEPALRRLHDFLARSYLPRARESIAASALPDGSAYYARLLRSYTTTDLTAEQIHQLGLSEVARIRKEMDAVVASTGFEGSFAEFLEYLRTDPRFFWKRPEDMVAGYRDIVKRIDPELIKLFGRLPRLPYGVKPMGEEANMAPSALYENGSLAAGRPGWMQINTFDLKARPKWAMESLAAHEAVPGHHLQYALVEELEALPAWRQWDVYPVFSEGWALYAETIGGELGLYKDPYSKFGQLNAEMWRAIRLVLDTGLHAYGWTRQQAIDYCRANSARTDREIVNEVDRYIAHPGGVTAYKIGELKIRELRRYAEKELGPAFDVRAFHDRVLGSGQLPLDLLQKSIEAWVAAVRAQPP
ncbi:MAG TPA: DUF885 family protein [Thermoanaerobaculia bacterium]|nr:DUF885 family protein [Thermoanaerobaculia bacterium]